LNGFKDATTDEATIRAWWKQWPDANVAVRTGAASQVLVIDPDGEEGSRSWANLQNELDANEDLALTPTSKTGRGHHVFFKVPAGVTVKSRIRFRPGLDVKAEDGYVLVSPSRHYSGIEYTWICSPDDSEIAELPRSILSKLNEPANSSGNGNGHKPSLDTARILDGVPEGARDDQIFRLACKLRRADVPQEWAERLCMEAAENSEQPPGRPFTAEDARDKVLTAYTKFQPGATRVIPVPADAAPRPALIPLKASDYNPNECIPVAFGHGDEVLFARGDLVLLGAAVAGGKTINLLAVTIAKALGRPLLNFECGEQEHAAAVLSDGDGSRPVLKRAARLLDGMGSDLSTLDGPNLRIFAVPGLCLDRPEDFEAVMNFVKEFDPALLALDSLNSMCGPERSRWSDADMGDFVRSRVRPLQRRPDGSDRTVLLAHHLKKPSQEKGAPNRFQDLLSGSYYILGAVDACVGLDGTGPETFLCRPIKRSRWGCTFNSFIARIEGGPGEPLRLANLGHAQPTPSEREDAESAFLSAMSTFPAGIWVRTIEVKKIVGPKFSERNVERAGKSLAKSGRLEPHPKTRGTYRLPNINQPHLPTGD
jgi:hypothetical protein